MSTKFLSVAFIFCLLFLTARPAFAVTVPNFPACPNVSGSSIAQYNSGTHGIVGDSGSHNGSDSVYQVSDQTVTQCFCADNGDGTQTNWWKASSLSDADVATLKSQGWFYAPNGNLWGLTSDAYVAQNSNFPCHGGTGGGGEVLGLATTGNLPIIASFLVIGLILLVSGLKLRKKSN